VIESITVRKEIRINKCRKSLRLPTELFESTNRSKEREIT